MRKASSFLLVLAATGACATRARQPLTAETVLGQAPGPPGRVLVISTNCGSMESVCRSGWAETVDGIVVGGLELNGYRTIDPSTLRRDEATRTESTVSSDTTAEHETQGTSRTLGIVAIFPVGTVTKTSSRSASVTRSRQKTVVVTGATLDDLRVEDRQSLMALAGAESVLSIRLVLGANYDSWSSSQLVEVMVKLSDAQDGTMRLATRCVASSADFPSVNSAIEAAARCAVGAMTKR